jgi:hypothetical protein
MVIEIPRWLDDAIDGQKWTLIGVAALAVFWTGYIAWYVAFTAQTPPHTPPAARSAASCVATPSPGLQSKTAHASRCLRDGSKAPRRPAAPSY